MTKPAATGLPVLALVGFGIVLAAMALVAAGLLPITGLVAVCGAVVGLAHARWRTCGRSQGEGVL